jgi:hypothetical protein
MPRLAISLTLVVALAACSPSSSGSDEKPSSIATPEATAAPAPTPATSVAGAISSRLNFDVNVHGFSFENYGSDNGETNLTPAEVVSLFGDVSCAGGTGPSCKLSPPAAAWMKEMNKSMEGGHCEGMAALSLLMQDGKIDPAQFGAPTAGGLSITGNEPLQREIAKWFSTQSLLPTSSAAFKGTPSGIVEKLRAWFANPATDLGYTLGFYKRDGSDGHAVTAIGLRDLPDGKVGIEVYDNNYPREVRVVTVDPVANTWSYSGSPNPAEAEGRYEGDAESNSIDLTPTATRIQMQECPFCGDVNVPGSATRGAARRTLVFIDPSAYKAGVRVSVTAVGGGAVEGVTVWRPRGGDLWDIDTSPVIQVPVGHPFNIRLDASAVTSTVSTGLVVVGPGISGGVDSISMDPGQIDSLFVDPATKTLRYTTTSNESPSLYFGIDEEPDSYSFTLAGVELGTTGGSIEWRVDTLNKKLTARSTGSDTATLLFSLARISDTVDETFENDGVQLRPDETLVIDYGRWKGNSTNVTIGIDGNGDGAIDETFEITDKP